MATLFSTMSKINKLEHITREAASSSSDSSTSSLGSLMTAAALNPWIQEARNAIEQQRAAAAAAAAASIDHKNGPIAAANRNEERAARSPTKPQMAAIFGHSPDARDPRGYSVDYSSAQPVFLAPLAGFAQPPRPRSNSPDGPRSMPAVLPLNMSMLRSPPGTQGEPSSPSYPVSTAAGAAIFLGKSSSGGHYFTTAPMPAHLPKRELGIEERMAQEEEANAKDAVSRDHAAYIEEALRQHSESKEASNNGNCSGSSRSSSIMGNYASECLKCFL